MKTLFIMLAIVSSSAFAGRIQRHNYQCIMSSLNAYNSDIFYDITPAEIDIILRPESGDARRWKVLDVTEQCDGTERPRSPRLDYTCIADRLEAYNSDVYYNLSKTDIDELLKGNSGLSWKAIEVAKECPAN